MDVGIKKRIHDMIGSAFSRCAVVLLLAVPVLSAAAEYIVVGEENNGIHSRFLDGFERQVEASGTGVSVRFVSRNNVKKVAGKISDVSLLVTVGALAAREIQNLDINVPTIHSLVSESYLREMPKIFGDNGKKTSIYIDQPPLRMLTLIKAALPDVKNVTIAVGEGAQRLDGEITAACNTLRLICDSVFIKDSAGIENALEKAARSDRVLLVLPDPHVINSSTVKTLILGAYMRRISLIGYSQALVKAGALMAVHSTPEQLGMDAANMATDALLNRPWRLPESRYPALFSVSVNYQLARALRVDLPSENTLEQAIKRNESYE